MITVEVRGMTRLSKKLGEMPGRIDAALQDFLSRAIFTIERAAKTSSLMRVDTGRMRASVGGGSFAGGSFPSGEGITILHDEASIGPTVNYAKYVHKKYPFMTDALNKSLPKFKEILKQSVKDAIS